MADGLAQALPPGDLTVIVNTGDDFIHLGLKICPDLDTVCYTLAGLANPVTGWGLKGDTFQALGSLAALGGPAWFKLGDIDLGVHLERTRRLQTGQTLSQVTQAFCDGWRIATQVLPMSDQPIPTTVYTDEGPLPFQEYFVHRSCVPKVNGFCFEGVEYSHPSPGLVQALMDADLVVICPSNPWVSIDPILAVPGVKQAVNGKSVIAVSPIVGGRAIKGPAAKMYAELGIEPSARAVAAHYGAFGLDGILTGLVMDTIDAGQSAQVEDLGMKAFVMDTIMTTPEARLHLAHELLNFGEG